MAREDSIIRGLLNKGRVVRDVEEPWWSKRYGDLLGKVPDVIEGFKGRKKEKAAEARMDLTTISGFEARLGNKLNNYMVSGDIYDESKITALKDSVNSLYDQHSSKFPELIAEFSDERDSALGIINNYSTKNKQKDLLLSKIEPTKQKLYSIVETLNTTLTEEFNPDERIKFRQEVYDTMEDITKLDKIIDDPYYAGIEGWADIAEDVKYGLSDASKQLITQINTWDAKENVISKQDLENLENAIFKNDTQGIRAVNEQIVGDKTARMTSYETDYAKSLKEYETINSFYASTAFQRTLNEKNEAYNKASKEEKKRMDLDPEYWRVNNIDVPGLPDEGVDVTQDVQIQLLRAKARANKIDADYRAEHIAGDSIAEILNKPLPWTKKRTSLVQKQEEHEKRMADLGLTVPSLGRSETVIAEGDEPFVVSELHKPITPTDTTMPTGEKEKKRKSVEERLSARNKEYAKKYNTSVEHIKSLRDSYDEDDTANMDFPLYLNRSANRGEFKNLTTEDAPSPLYKVDDGKPVVPETSKPFVKAQSDLSSIASNKFSNLSASEKGKYKGSKEEATRKFVKDKFEQWLKTSGNLRKAKWKTKGKYAVEDFKYFIPTTYEGTNKRLFYPGAFKRPSLMQQPTGLSPLEYAKQRSDLIFSPNVVVPDMSDDGYTEFVKDFDAFRKFLQES